MAYYDYRCMETENREAYHDVLETVSRETADRAGELVVCERKVVKYDTNTATRQLRVLKSCFTLFHLELPFSTSRIHQEPVL